MSKFDVDIDVPGHTDKEKFGVRGIIYDRDHKRIQPHPSAHYLDTNIPVDGITGMAAIDYEEAEELGYIKVDLLTNTAYNRFKSKEEVLEALNREPDWDMFLNPKVVEKLPHLARWGEILEELRPRSIEDLADILALIRPGKSGLIHEYKKNKEKVRKILYSKPKKGMYFKKSHAIAYAAMIVCVLNSIDNERLIKF
jgi:hypothetical protein